MLVDDFYEDKTNQDFLKKLKRSSVFPVRTRHFNSELERFQIDFQQL